MNDVAIILYFNKHRLYALADVLGQQTADTVEDKLAEDFDMLYEEYVPKNKELLLSQR